MKKLILFNFILSIGIGLFSQTPVTGPFSYPGLEQPQGPL